MTVGGLYGSEFEAGTPEEAAELAEAAGYDVLDFSDHGTEIVLVVAD
jgi:hypothetical protein